MIETYNFDMLDWIETSVGIRQKGFESGGQRYRLVEYAVSGKHEEWCARGHRGLVLEGSVEFETPEETVQVRTGEAFNIPEGTPHRARNAADTPTRFFLAD